MTFEEEMIAVAEELLQEYGFAVLIDRVQDNTYDAASLSVSKQPLTMAGYAAFIDPSNSKLTGYEQSLTEDNVEDRKWMIVRAPNKVRTGDVFRYSGSSYTVRSATGVGPTGTSIYYRVATDKTK